MIPKVWVVTLITTAMNDNKLLTVFNHIFSSKEKALKFVEDEAPTTLTEVIDSYLYGHYTYDTVGGTKNIVEVKVNRKYIA